MSRDRLKTKTVLLALAGIALVALVTPAAADQTERRNITVSDNDYLITYSDTGNTTIEARNSTGSVLQTLDSRNITTQKYTLLAGTPPDAERLVISTERPGVTIRSGNRTARDSNVGIDSPIRYEADVPTDSNATVISAPGSPSGQFRDYTALKDERDMSQTTVNVPISDTQTDALKFPVSDQSDSYAIVFSTNDNASANISLVQQFYQTTISPGDSVEALRVMQSNSHSVDRARVTISGDDGETLINETLPDAQTSVGYGALEFDNSSEYNITVTGVNNWSDPTPHYSVSKLKSNDPILALGGDTNSRAQLLGAGLIFTFVVMYFRTRES
jgi:hypothetical protein